MKTIKDMRLKNNITQADLAEALKVSPSTIGMYEQGRRQPDNKTLIALAEYFNTSTDCLLGKSPHILPYSNEALEIARKYDRVDKRGQNNIKSVVDHEYKLTAEAKTKEGLVYE